MNGDTNTSDQSEQLARVNRVFTPHTPVETPQFFAGRKSELHRIQDTLVETGCHVILYGNRGVGKTSLANIIGSVNSAEDSPIQCSKVSCYHNEKFHQLWLNAFKHIYVNTEIPNKRSIGFPIDPNFDDNSLSSYSSIPLSQLIGNKELEPSDVLDILQALDRQKNLCLFIFDEFDRVDDAKVKDNFTFLLKSLSDNSTTHTVMLVGIADDIDGLLENHQSLQRCLKQVFLDCLSNSELEEIIDNGLHYLGLKINDSVKQRIIFFSQGFPQFTHLLCKYCAKAAINLFKVEIDIDDFNVAVNQAIDDTFQAISGAYQKATMNDRGSIYEQVLIASAISDTDAYSTFTSPDVRNTLTKCGVQNCKNSYLRYLDALTEKDRGSILKRVPSSKSPRRFEFRNPLIRAHLKMKAYQMGYIKQIYF
ncbi:MAG: ATP-binding protein [Halothece sp. Uz-M2-17]|nr:ATP-binding protein [Halothece sp. Uz-M2-17]